MSSEATEHLVSELNKFKQMAVITVSVEDMHDILEALVGDDPDKMMLDEINNIIDVYVGELTHIGRDREHLWNEEWYADKIVSSFSHSEGSGKPFGSWFRGISRVAKPTKSSEKSNHSADTNSDELIRWRCWWQFRPSIAIIEAPTRVLFLFLPSSDTE